MNRVILLLTTILFGWSGVAICVDIPVPQTEGELFSLLGTLKGTTLPEAKKIERCVRETNGFIHDYKAIKDRYLAKDPSNKALAIDSLILPNAMDHDLNLVRNFRRLKDHNSEFFRAISHFIDERGSLESRMKLENIEDSFKDLQRKSADLSNQLYPLAVKESHLLYLTSASREVIKEHLMRNRTMLGMLIGKECQNASVSSQILILQDDAEGLIAAISEMRDFVIALRKKRTAIVDRLLVQSRLRLDREWREEFVRQGKETLDSIDGLIELTRLGAVFDEYWHSVSMNGLADSKHLRYLQYEEPMRLLTAEIQRLKVFEKDFRRIQNAPQNLMLAYANRSLSYQKLVIENLDKLVKSGWRGQLERQIMLNEKRLLIADKFSMDCITTINMHLSRAKTAQNIEQFRVVETVYKSVVDLCVK